jgi:hypothetical protein
MRTGKPRAYRLRSYDEFLAAVNEIRTTRGLSYRGLGALVGAGHTHTGRWMRREVHMLASTAWALARGLGYDIALIPREPEEDA